MSDVIDTAEIPATDSAQEQTTETTQVTGSEAVQTQPEANQDRGDVNEALRQAREEARTLRQSLQDPTFIYNQAKSLGLTEEQAQETAQTQSPVQQNDSFGQYKYFREIEKSQEKYPQLASDEEDQLAITALMRAKGLSPLAAADRYYSKMNKAVDAAKVEGAKEKEATISDKERAQTVTSTVASSSENAEYEDILSRSRNQNNPKAAAKAQLELIQWKEAHRN